MARRPVIGLTCCSDSDMEEPRYIVSKAYIDAIQAAGGIPVVLPSTFRDEREGESEDPLKDLLERIDGLLLTGGVDVNPILYGEEPHPKLGRIDPLRDEFELDLIRRALECGMPVLGICRGIQVLNIVAGGENYQDIASLEIPNPIKHMQNGPRWSYSHTVEMEEGSRLQVLLGQRRVFVNSFHHQAIKSVAPGFRVSARAGDGIIEAIEMVGPEGDDHFVMGVQWHPETMYRRDQGAAAIFEGFVEACRR